MDRLCAIATAKLGFKNPSQSSTQRQKTRKVQLEGAPPDQLVCRNIIAVLAPHLKEFIPSPSFALVKKIALVCTAKRLPNIGSQAEFPTKLVFSALCALVQM